MMSTDLTPGTIVEFEDEGWNGHYYPVAVVVEQPADQLNPNDSDAWIWVETNDNVFPVREYRLRVVPLKVVVARLNER